VAAKPDFTITNDNAPAVAEICARLGCAEVGRIGHVTILFLQQPDPAKRRVVLDADR